MKRHNTSETLLVAGCLLLLQQNAQAGTNGLETDYIWATDTGGTNYFMGKVGIGTNKPLYMFHLIGDMKVSGAVRVPKQGDLEMGTYINGDAGDGVGSATTVPEGHMGNLLYHNGKAWVTLTNLFYDTAAGRLYMNVTNTGVYLDSVGLQGDTRYVTTNSTGALSFGGNTTIAKLMPTSKFTNGCWVTPTLASNRTVNLNNTMTVAEMQAVVSAQPRNLGACTLTFQFAAGTYSGWGTYLLFDYFYGGNLTVRGAGTTTYSFRTNQTTILNMAASSSSALLFYYTTGLVALENMVVVGNTVNNYDCVYVQGCTQMGVADVYLLGNGKTGSGKGLDVIGPAIVSTYVLEVGNMDTAFYSQSASLLSVNTVKWTNSIPDYGVYVNGAIAINMVSSGLGTTANTKINGGQIGLASTGNWY